ncbi:MAG: hypothetical protein ABEJ87_01970 [Candidatus Nanohalobium sp.]
MSIAPQNPDRTEKAWNALYDLDDEDITVSQAFDRIETDHSLPRNVPAATQFDNYQLMMGELADEEPEALLKLNDTFFYLDQGKQDEVLLHEAMHGLEGKNRLMPQLRYGKGISQEFQEDLVTAFNYGGIDSTEGVVQALAAELNGSNVGDYFRRYETRNTHDRWREKGLDPGKELSGEIEDFRQEAIAELGGREVYDVQIDEGLYFEYGEFLGEGYSVTVAGEDAEIYGGEIAQNYLEDVYGGLNDMGDLDLEEKYEDEYEREEGFEVAEPRVEDI